jgi:uncharacterized protein (TIGR03084 family)
VDKELAALAAQQDELSALLATLDEQGWQTPSRCAGWTVADVVLHLAQTNELALASLRGRFSDAVAELAAAPAAEGSGSVGGLGPAATADEGAAAMVERERGLSAAAVRERWQAGADDLRRELAEAEPGRRVEWVAGRLSVRTLATTRLAETWIHTGDVAVPLGRPRAMDDRLWHIARLAWRTLPYALARAGRELSGPVAFALDAPNGDTWHFAPDDDALTVVEGAAVELCEVAGQRADAADTGLRAEGPDAAAVLELVRTFA